MMLARLRYRRPNDATPRPFMDGALLPLDIAEAAAADLRGLGCEVLLTRCASSTARLLYPAAYATAAAHFNDVGGPPA